MVLEDSPEVGIAKRTELATGQPGRALAPNGNLACIGHVKRAQDLKKGGFAGTRRAHNAHNLACIHSQVHPAENLQLPKPFDDVRGLNHA